MSVYKRPNSQFHHYDFQLKGHRFCGTTERASRKEAEAVEAVERDKAKALVKAMQRARTSLLIDDGRGCGTRARGTTPTPTRPRPTSPG